MVAVNWRTFTRHLQLIRPKGKTYYTKPVVCIGSFEYLGYKFFIHKSSENEHFGKVTISEEISKANCLKSKYYPVKTVLDVFEYTMKEHKVTEKKLADAVRVNKEFIKGYKYVPLDMENNETNNVVWLGLSLLYW